MLNRILNIIILLIILVPTLLNSQETGDVTLKWEDVPKSLGYVIEARDKQGKLILSEKITRNSYDIENFQPGIYEHRVGVINKFGKVESFTEWVPFEIVKSIVPVFGSKKVYSAGQEENIKQLEIKGENFLDNMKIYLKNENEIIQATSVKISPDGKTASAIFQTKDIPELGLYDVVLENPRKKIATNTKNFVFAKNKDQAEKVASRQVRIMNNEIPPDYYSTPYWSTMWRSAILPGWGQDYIDDKRWKLYVYPVVLLGAAGVYAKSYKDFLVARSEYYDSVQMGFILTSTSSSSGDIIFLYTNQQSTNQYNVAKSRLNQIQIGAGVVGLFAIYNIVDAYLSARRNVAQNDLKTLPIGEGIDFRAKSEIRSSQSIDANRLENYQSLEFIQSF
jgi:hypothetical protein